MKKIFHIGALLLPLLISCSGKKETEQLPQEPETTVNVSQEQEKNDGLVYTEDNARRIKVKNIGVLAKVFNDSNYLQLETAQKLGIKPITGVGSAYFTSRPIVKITDTENYRLDTLTHSVPYLVPEAAALLDRIGKDFKDSLAARGGDSHLIKVTSLLRTPESVGRLRRVNINATDSSTHQYGTTFDISYVKFYCSDPTRVIHQGDLKNLLGEVLLALRDEGACMVKYERKTGCYHVTACK